MDDHAKYRRICRDGLYGYAIGGYQQVLPCKWEDASAFSEGLAAVKLDGKWGIIDTTGEEVVPCQWVWLKREKNGIVIVADAIRDDGAKHCGVIDTTGSLLIPCAWRSEFRYLGEGLFCGRESEGEAYFLLDRNGTQIGSAFEEVRCFSEGLAVCRAHNLYGFLNAEGEIALPCVWQQVKDFSHGVARVTQDGSKWGLIDRSGTLIMPCEWDEVRGFSEGMAAVRRDAKWGYINTAGRLVVPCEWDYAGDFFGGNHHAVVYRLTEDHGGIAYDATDFTYILDKEDFDIYLVVITDDQSAQVYPMCKTCVAKLTKSDDSNLYICPKCGEKAKLEGDRLIWEDVTEIPE